MSDPLRFNVAGNLSFDDRCVISSFCKSNGISVCSFVRLAVISLYCNIVDGSVPLDSALILASHVHTISDFKG